MKNQAENNKKRAARRKAGTKNHLRVEREDNREWSTVAPRTTKRRCKRPKTVCLQRADTAEELLLKQTAIVKTKDNLLFKETSGSLECFRFAVKNYLGYEIMSYQILQKRLFIVEEQWNNYEKKNNNSQKK